MLHLIPNFKSNIISNVYINRSISFFKLRHIFLISLILTIIDFYKMRKILQKVLESIRSFIINNKSTSIFSLNGFLILSTNNKTFLTLYIFLNLISFYLVLKVLKLVFCSFKISNKLYYFILSIPFLLLYLFIGLKMFLLNKISSFAHIFLMFKGCKENTNEMGSDEFKAHLQSFSKESFLPSEVKTNTISADIKSSTFTTSFVDEVKNSLIAMYFYIVTNHDFEVLRSKLKKYSNNLLNATNMLSPHMKMLDMLNNPNNDNDFRNAFNAFLPFLAEKGITDFHQAKQKVNEKTVHMKYFYKTLQDQSNFLIYFLKTFDAITSENITNEIEKFVEEMSSINFNYFLKQSLDLSSTLRGLSNPLNKW